MVNPTKATEYVSSLAENISQNENLSNSTSSNVQNVLPFEIIENTEKNRINIKFDSKNKNPYFNDIIKELKTEHWKFSPFNNLWYPLKIEGSHEFAQNLQGKYFEILNIEGASMSENNTSKAKKTFKDTPTFKNAAFFLEENQKGSLPFFKGKEKVRDGKDVIEINPHPVVDALTGRLIIGTNQIISQDIFLKTGEYPKNINVITYAQAKANGIKLKKNSPSFTITTRDKENKYNIYKLFSEKSITDDSLGNLKRAKYSSEVQKRIKVLNRQLEQEENEQNKSVILTSLAYAHLDNIKGNILRPKEIELGAENFRNSSELENRSKEVKEYIDNLPDDVKKQFEEKIMVKNDKIDNSTPENLVKNYNSEEFEKTADRYFKKAEEYEANRPEQVIDARNCVSATNFLAKYEAASTLSKVNPNVKFITDKSTNEKIQNELNVMLEKAFSENNHTKVFSIGREANEVCKQELQNFRSQQFQKMSTEQEINSQDKSPSIDMSR